MVEEAEGDEPSTSKGEIKGTMVVSYVEGNVACIFCLAFGGKLMPSTALWVEWWCLLPKYKGATGKMCMGASSDIQEWCVQRQWHLMQMVEMKGAG